MVLVLLVGVGGGIFEVEPARQGEGLWRGVGGWGWEWWRLRAVGVVVVCPGMGVGIRPPSAHPQTRTRHPPPNGWRVGGRKSLKCKGFISK